MKTPHKAEAAAKREQQRTSMAHRRAEKPGRGLAAFLKARYREQGWSRAEAARRAGITEGYLSNLFSGVVQLPRGDVVQQLARGWGFNAIDLLTAAGYVCAQDLEALISSNVPIGLVPRSIMDISEAASILADLAPEERQAILTLLRGLRPPGMTLKARRG